jgi:hypothetical protein
MNEAVCKISASHFFPIAQTPADTRSLLSPILKPPEKILTPKKFKYQFFQALIWKSGSPLKELYKLQIYKLIFAELNLKVENCPKLPHDIF